MSQLEEEDRETAAKRRKGLMGTDDEGGNEKAERAGEGEGSDATPEASLEAQASATTSMGANGASGGEAPRLEEEVLEADHVVLAVGHRYVQRYMWPE